MEFKGNNQIVPNLNGFAGAMQKSQPMTAGNPSYSVCIQEHTQQQPVFDYSIVGIILVFLIVCIGIVVYRK